MTMGTTRTSAALREAANVLATTVAGKVWLNDLADAWAVLERANEENIRIIDSLKHKLQKEQGRLARARTRITRGEGGEE